MVLENLGRFWQWTTKNLSWSATRNWNLEFWCSNVVVQMEVTQPAAKMLVELSKSQDIVAGDGTTTGVTPTDTVLDVFWWQFFVLAQNWADSCQNIVNIMQTGSFKITQHFVHMCSSMIFYTCGIKKFCNYESRFIYDLKVVYTAQSKV